MTIKQDIQTLEPGALVQLLTLDATAYGLAAQHFHNHAQEASIWFQGIEYLPWPYEVEGLQVTGQQQPQPTITVSNYGGYVTGMCLSYQDLVGAVVTIRTTMVKYLDAVNFPGGVNPTADPTQEFTPEIWMVERKAYEDFEKVQFELTAPMDTQGQQLPGRQIVAGRCLWLAIGGYRGPYCGYAGPAVAKSDDTPTSTMSEDKCGGRVASCKLRFGENAELPHGGFPAAGMMR